jgi:hypothetical protein
MCCREKVLPLLANFVVWKLRFFSWQGPDEAVQAGMQYLDHKAEESGLIYSEDGKGGFKYQTTLV